MAKSKCALILILILPFLFSCKEDKKVDFGDDNFHFALYTDPSGDCISCNLIALKMLNDFIDKNQKLRVILKKSKHNENFKIMLEEDFAGREFLFIENKLKVPHPSILLIKKSSVYMYFYISNDHFKLKEYLKSCSEFFLEFNKRNILE
jgi:hypothetical protein